MALVGDNQQALVCIWRDRAYHSCRRGNSVFTISEFDSWNSFYFVGMSEAECDESRNVITLVDSWRRLDRRLRVGHFQCFVSYTHVLFSTDCIHAGPPRFQCPNNTDR